jgi:prepilin-type N-terminal cleavage/methylation domain-containing protein
MNRQRGPKCILPGVGRQAVNRKTNRKVEKNRGFSTLELLVVIAITLVIAGIAVPGMVQTWYGLQLRATAGEVADLMQRARMQAARANISPGIPIRYRVLNGMQQVYADFNNNGAWDQGEPIIDLPRVNAAAGAPNGNPANYVDPMDTTAGAPCDNTCTLAFSPRGLPCNLVGNACPTPSPSYFVYYFQDGRANGWAAVLVSKAGRTRVLLWNGTTWK